jgi:hypothetical protein
MEMVKSISMFAGILAWTAPVTAAADFSLTIGNPVAASGPNTAAPVDKAAAPVIKKVAKDALFAVRFENCTELDKAQLSGVAEGVANGARVSAPVILAAAGSPGVYVVGPGGPGWSQDRGLWVVSLSATCGKSVAGAIVPISPQGFVRDKTKTLPRVATKAEIEAVLKSLETGK